MVDKSRQGRRTFNPKRQIRNACGPAELARLAERVTYTGNPAHKKEPGDFDLIPPSQPRPDKTLCDAIGITSKAEALRLLRAGITKGLVSVQTRGGFPQNVWAVTQAGLPLEAQLENQTQGAYHGYPMPRSDDFREEVRKRWEHS